MVSPTSASLVAEAAKLALGDDNIIERCFIVELLLDAKVPNQIAGAVGFSVRENIVYIIKCKTMMVACGGAVNIYQPRSVGEGKGRAWYPVWNAGSTYTMCMKVGAELTMMENRFTPARFKDGYGPVGAWVPAVQGQNPQRSGRKLCRQRRCQSRTGKIRAIRHGGHYPDLSCVTTSCCSK